MLAFMSRHDWLSSYATIKGIEKALGGLSARVPGGEVLTGAGEILKEHRAEFIGECMRFLPQLRNHLNQADAKG